MFRWISIVGLIGAAALPVLHYLFWVRMRFRPGRRAGRVMRFSVTERVAHGTALVSFVVVAATGFWAVIVACDALRGWWWVAHVGAGGVFAVALGALALLWAADCRFVRHDWTWTKCLGGYLGGRGAPPAGRFNGGQKAFFWAAVALGMLTLSSGLLLIVPVFASATQEWVYECHRYAALLFVIAVIGHAYLGIFANPGTLRGIVFGTVAVDWVKHHHSLWSDEPDPAIGKPDGNERAAETGGRAH